MEVILAMVIVGVLITVLAQGMAIGARREAAADRQYLAAMYAAGVLSRIEATSAGSEVGGMGDFGPDHPEMTYAVETATVEAGLTEIRVVVMWTEADQPREYELVRWRKDPS